jgi:Transmembrane domain of unknown function (DUF3566)
VSSPHSNFGNGSAGSDPAATTTMLPASEPAHVNGVNGAGHAVAPPPGANLAGAKTDHIPQSPLNVAPVGPPPGAAPVPPPAVPAPLPVPPAPANTVRSSSRRAADRPPRRAHLQLRHIDAWSVLKLACVLAFALFFVWLVVIGVLYGVLDLTGVIGKINDTAHTLYNNNHDPVTPGIVLGGALVIGVINIVLFIVLSTIGSIVYNLCSDLVGGIEVTLSERQ